MTSERSKRRDLLALSFTVTLARNESRIERNETRLERNETRNARNETRLARNETRGGNLHLSGTV